MPDPAVAIETATNPITYELLWAVIGALIVGIFSIVAWVFRNNVSAIWSHVREQRTDLKDHMKDKAAHGIGVMAQQINSNGVALNEIKADNRKATEDRRIRDKELFDKIDESNKTSASQFKEIQTMIWDHLVDRKSE